MTRMRRLKTAFTAGEISTELLGRADLKGYDRGAALLRNVFIRPTGGVSRRPGLRYVDTLDGPVRLIAFEFNTKQEYLLVFGDGWMDVYKGDVKLVRHTVPWREDDLNELAWTQNADTLYVSHPDYVPCLISRSENETEWRIEDYTFQKDDGYVRQPYYKFGAPATALTLAAKTGATTLTADADVFVADHAGMNFRFRSGQVRIDTVVDARTAQVTVIETIDKITETLDWGEPALSSLRGWPATVTFHQNRLVFGGSRDLPNRIWMSQVSAPENFDVAEGLDDEAIDFALVSDQVNAIRAVFSGRHLQVFTAGAEWMVSGETITPEKVQAQRQTRIGSLSTRKLPPRNVDGATMFIDTTGRQLREFLYTDLEQAYQSNDVTLLAPHLMNAPCDQDYDPERRLLYTVMGDGTLATLTIFRSERVTAWTVQETDGAFENVCIAQSRAYAVVLRDGIRQLERFDDALHTDGGLDGTSSTPTATWLGLAHLEGRSVAVVADGVPQPYVTVTDGRAILERQASAAEIGLPFTHKVHPLPPMLTTARGATTGVPIRLIRAVFRLRETRAVRVDTGGGFRELPFKALGTGAVLDTPAKAYTGDKALTGIGWVRDIDRPLWRIEQATPLAFTLLSVTEEIKVND